MQVPCLACPTPASFLHLFTRIPSGLIKRWHSSPGAPLRECVVVSIASSTMVQTRSARNILNGHVNGHVKGSAHTNGHTVAPAAQNERTDRSRWRLKDEQGRHTWHYLETDEQVKEWPQSVVDKHHLGLDTVSSTHPVQLQTNVPGTARPSFSLKTFSSNRQRPHILLSNTAPGRPLGNRV